MLIIITYQLELALAESIKSNRVFLSFFAEIITFVLAEIHYIVLHFSYNCFQNNLSLHNIYQKTLRQALLLNAKFL